MWKEKPENPCAFLDKADTRYIGCVRSENFNTIRCGMLYEVEDGGMSV